MLDLAGIMKHIHRGKNGTMPIKPLKQGVGLFDAPHVYIALVGQFKGETGVREHLIEVASKTMSGIETRWWIGILIQIRNEEGYTSGPAFGHADGSLTRLREYDDVLHEFLERVQAEPNKVIQADDEVCKFYSLFRTFRKAAEGRARAMGLDEQIQNTMNRWRKIEGAGAKRPRFNMADHYSSVRDLMPVMWRYTYIQ